MICETCFGVGEVLIDKAGKVVSQLADAVLLVPCPDCGGSGVGYCCDGLCAQAEDTARRASSSGGGHE